MTWLIWRQYRASGAITAALLAAFAAAILADGFQIASHWHSILLACAGNSVCLQQEPSPVNGVVSDLPYLSLIVPVVLGILWGAPLVAHEFETRTTDFAWAQTVTRTRWLAVKAGWLLLAATACGGATTALITWWSGPVNASQADAFQSPHFDTQGIVPIGYAVFAMALGIAAGTVARRTLPSQPALAVSQRVRVTLCVHAKSLVRASSSCATSGAPHSMPSTTGSIRLR